MHRLFIAFAIVTSSVFASVGSSYAQDSSWASVVIVDVRFIERAVEIAMPVSRTVDPLVVGANTAE